MSNAIAKAATVRRPSKKELAESAAKAAKRQGLVKLTPVSERPTPSARSETVAEQMQPEQKPAKKSKTKPVEAPAVEKTAETKPEQAKDGWGRKLGTASHFVCRAVVEAGDDGATAKELALAAARLALAAGVPPRGAVGSQLADMKEQGHVTLEDGKWKATAEGRKAWGAK